MLPKETTYSILIFEPDEKNHSHFTSVFKAEISEKEGFFYQLTFAKTLKELQTILVSERFAATVSDISGLKSKDDTIAFLESKKDMLGEVFIIDSKGDLTEKDEVALQNKFQNVYRYSVYQAIGDYFDCIANLVKHSVKGHLSDLSEKIKSLEKGKKGYILLLEDDDFLRSIYLELLTDDGYGAIAAADGIEGIFAAKLYPFDLVITCIMLPQMDGLEMMDVLKKISATKDVPVAVLTGLAAKEVVAEAFRRGAVDYWNKSELMPDQLLQKVNKLFEKKI